MRNPGPATVEPRSRIADSGGQERRVLAALSVILLVLVAGTVRSATRKHAAARELDALVGEILERERVTNALPDSLDDLGWRLPPIVGGTRPVDPWGRALVYRVQGAAPVKGARFEIAKRPRRLTR